MTTEKGNDRNGSNSLSWRVVATGACIICVSLAGGWAQSVNDKLKEHDASIVQMQQTLARIEAKIDAALAMRPSGG